MPLELIKKLDDSYSGFIREFLLFTPADINVIPFQNSWTAGQVAEHIARSGTAILTFISGHVRPTSRPPGLYVPDFRMAFLNFTVKMSSPEFILPLQTTHDRNVLVAQLDGIRDGLLQAARTMDLTQTCIDFERPGVGALTRLEWLEFSVVHTLRHTHQLRHMKEVLHTA